MKGKIAGGLGVLVGVMLVAWALLFFVAAGAMGMDDVAGVTREATRATMSWVTVLPVLAISGGICCIYYCLRRPSPPR